MNKQEAEQFLRYSAHKRHEVFIATAGVSHGDPGGYRYISSACPCVTHDGYTIKAFDESVPCTCGAGEHNLKVDRAITKLQEP